MKKQTLACFPVLFWLAFLTMASCNTSEKEDIVFNARALIGQSPEGVVEVLGEPDSTYQRSIFGKRFLIQYYNHYGIEVRTLQGTVANVIVNEPYPLEFKPQTITKFGLDYVEPTEYDSLAMIMWKNIEGFKVINFYLRGVRKPDSVKYKFHVFFNMDTTTTKK